MTTLARRRWFWLGLAAVLLLDVWLRGHAVGPVITRAIGFDPYFATSAESEPLDCDEAIYGYIGRRLAGGSVMYRDLTENKPPGGYWLFAAAVKLGGPGELTIRLMPLPFVLATVVLVGLVGRSLGGEGAGVVGALVFALVSTDPFLYGESANMEHMINAFSFASAAALIRASGGPYRRPWLAAAGVLLGSACLVKQTSALNLLVFAPAVLWETSANGPRRNWVRLADLGAFAAGLLAVLILAVGVLVAQGAGPDAFEDIVRYGRALATETPAPPNSPPFLVRWVTGNAAPDGALPWPFGKTDYLVWWGTGTWPVWLAAVPATAWLLFGPGSNGPRRLLAVWTVSAWVQAAMPGLFWAHYYLLPVPGVAAGVGVFFVEMAGRSRAGSAGPWRYAFAAGLTALALAATAWLQFNEYLRVPPVGLVRDRGGSQWVVNRSLGREIGRRSAVWPKPSLFVWGWQGPLYFYSGLDGVTRQVFVDDFLKAHAGADHPVAGPRIRRTMADLRATPPSLIFAGYPPFPALKAFLDEHYLPSRLAPGLYVERSRYGEFETFRGP